VLRWTVATGLAVGGNDGLPKFRASQSCHICPNKSKLAVVRVQTGRAPLRVDGQHMSELDFRDRAAIVTGAGAGLGRCHAMLLAQRGAQVVVNDADPARAEDTVAAISASGGSAVADGTDVSTSVGGEKIVQAALDNFGRLDVLVNNAGIVRDRSFHNLSNDELDAVLAVHVGGAFNLTRPAWRVMREAGYGKVLFTTSAAGIWGNFGQANYSAAKAALIGLSNTLAIEGERSGLKSNVIAPIAATSMTDGLLGNLTDAADPALVSPLVAWLCHESCDASGHVYSVGGGRVARVVTTLTAGLTSKDAPLTPEMLRDHWEQVSALEPGRPALSLADDFRALRDALRG
jgi:NAD(P)-dependent dehydrogenase (short-subunit alcohol dehydrogenase family)